MSTESSAKTAASSPALRIDLTDLPNLSRFLGVIEKCRKHVLFLFPFRLVSQGLCLLRSQVPTVTRFVVEPWRPATSLISCRFCSNSERIRTTFTIVRCVCVLLFAASFPKSVVVGHT